MTQNGPLQSLAVTQTEHWPPGVVPVLVPVLPVLVPVLPLVVPVVVLVVVVVVPDEELCVPEVPVEVAPVVELLLWLAVEVDVGWLLVAVVPWVVVLVVVVVVLVTGRSAQKPFGST